MIFGTDGVIKADDTVCFEEKCIKLEDYCSEVTESFANYFRKRLKEPLKQKYINYS